MNMKLGLNKILVKQLIKRHLIIIIKYYKRGQGYNLNAI